MDSRSQAEREHTQRAIEEAHVAAGASEMAEAGRETARRFSTAWENAKNNIQEKAVTSAKATDRAIREHPYESIGIAFGIGVLIGVLINRR